MKSRTVRRFARKENHIGFQIAPMIDVVFVILLFFMVAAGAKQKENANMMELPSIQGSEISLPDEVVISIEENGQVYLNDDPVDDSSTRDLKQLAAEMTALAKASKGSGAVLLVTIQPNESVKYERVVHVLDALTRANVKGVTFQSVED